MKLTLVGGPPQLRPRAVRWAGHSCRTLPHRFDRIVHLDMDNPEGPVEVDRLGVELFAEEMQACEAIICEVPEAALLAMEWMRRGLAPRPIIAIEVHGLRRVRPLARWCQENLGRDPWRDLLQAAWISVVAASAVQEQVLLEAGLPRERIHRIDGCTALFEMVIPNAAWRMDGGLRSDARDAVGLPRDTVLVAGSGRRDQETYLRAAARLPGLPFAVIDAELESHRDHLERQGLLALPQVRFLPPQPLERFIALVKRARLVVVAVKPGPGDAGHTTVATAHRVGTPLICSQVPGLEDYVTHTVDAWLVPPGDPARLAEAMEALWRDDVLRRRLADAGRTREAARIMSLRGQTLAALERAVQGLPPGRTRSRSRRA